MGLVLTMALQGNLLSFLEADAKTLAQANATVIRRTTTNAKNADRREVKKAGLGKLENTVRGVTDPPKGPSTTIIGTVYSKAVVKRGGKVFDLLEVFESGAVIRARGKTFLAIPTALVGRTGKRRSQPGDYAAGELEPRIKQGASRGVLVFADGRGVAFILLTTVTLKKRLPDLKAIAIKFGDRMDEQLVKEWSRLATEAGGRLQDYLKV